MPTPGKRSSMRQIAAAAGVSVATVSHVINGSGRFSEDTRERVEAAVEEYGYVTNMAAKSLRMAQSRTIGMIVPDISNDFFSKIALHVERELATEDYSVFVCNSANDPARERDYFRTLASKQADGIICISGLRSSTANLSPTAFPWSASTARPKTTSVSRTWVPTTSAAATWQPSTSSSAAARTS